MSRSFRRVVIAVSAAAVLLASGAFASCWYCLTPLDASPLQTPATVTREGRVTIVGTVVDGALTPLPGVVVTLQSASTVVAKVTSDASGTFRIPDVAPGSYHVRAEVAGFPAVARDLRVPAGHDTLQLPLVMKRPGDERASGGMADAINVQTGQPAAGRGGAAPYPQGLPAPAALPPPLPAGASGGRGGGFIGDRNATAQRSSGQMSESVIAVGPYRPSYPSGEGYAHVASHQFQFTRDEPLSTFGADVDTASYANVRRYLSMGQLPPADAVRVEEFVNYFTFPYAAANNGRPIALTTEVGDCPWAPTHKLVLIGARARTSSLRDVEGRNIVLLVDVSGSMSPAERLPMLKTAFGMFVDTLQPDDRLAIVTYAGTSGVVLPSTPVRRRDEIHRAIDSLGAGGSTNGGSGLITAYRTAREEFIPGGVNRVILATDGDFNVGITSRDALYRLIEREKSSGVFLSVLGVGSGNLQDATMELLADKGNGHYAYLDSLQEARRVLVHESSATLETVAKDVKFQVEFNPAMVKAWKQIGYENRAMAAQDFNDDRKDGGEMGAGHTVTALYEIVPVGVDDADVDVRDRRPAIDALKYQPSATPAADRPSDIVRSKPAPTQTGEWLTVKARFKHPEGERSDVIAQAVRSGGRTEFLPLASAVAEFGMLLRDEAHDRTRWAALERRVGRLTPPAALVSETRELVELVAIAKGIR